MNTFLEVSIEHFQPVRLAYRGCILLRTHCVLVLRPVSPKLVMFKEFELNRFSFVLYMLLATMSWAARCLLCTKPTMTRAPGPPKMSSTSLTLEGRQPLTVRLESNPDFPTHNPVCYLYVTAGGRGTQRQKLILKESVAGKG